MLEPSNEKAAAWLKGVLAEGPLLAKELRDRLEAEDQPFGMSTVVWTIWWLVSAGTCEITKDHRVRLL